MRNPAVCDDPYFWLCSISTQVLEVSPGHLSMRNTNTPSNQRKKRFLQTFRLEGFVPYDQMLATFGSNINSHMWFLNISNVPSWFKWSVIRSVSFRLMGWWGHDLKTRFEMTNGKPGSSDLILSSCCVLWQLMFASILWPHVNITAAVLPTPDIYTEFKLLTFQILNEFNKPWLPPVSRDGAAARSERLQAVKPAHPARLPPAGQSGGTADISSTFGHLIVLLFLLEDCFCHK